MEMMANRARISTVVSDTSQLFELGMGHLTKFLLKFLFENGW